jgi:hypothetical protein
MTRREFVAGSALVALSVQGRGVLAQRAAGVGCVVKTPLGVLRGEVVAGARRNRLVVACGCTPALPPMRAKNARSGPGSSAERWGLRPRLV